MRPKPSFLSPFQRYSPWVRSGKIRDFTKCPFRQFLVCFCKAVTGNLRESFFLIPSHLLESKFCYVLHKWSYFSNFTLNSQFILGALIFHPQNWYTPWKLTAVPWNLWPITYHVHLRWHHPHPTTRLVKLGRISMTSEIQTKTRSGHWSSINNKKSMKYDSI